MAVEVNEELKTATQGMHEATRALRKAQELAEKRGEEAGAETGELKERMEKAEAGIVEWEAKWRDAEAKLKAAEQKAGEIETKMQLMERHRAETPSVDQAEAEIKAHERAFAKAMKGGAPDARGHVLAKHRLTDEEEKALTAMEEKSISMDGNENGGFLMPQAQQGDLIRKLIEWSPLEELADSTDIGLGDTWEVTREGDQDFVCNWTSERGTRSETQAGHVAKTVITAHEIYAKPLASQKSLDDPAFDVARWLVERLARRFRVKRGEAFITGDGAGKPEGITTNATAIGSGDYGYVPMGHASTIDSGDGLWDVAFDLPEFYADRATWLWRRATSAIIRKLKDGEDRYIWAPAFEGTPPTVCDRPYREAIDMPAVAANAHAVALGAWADAYMVVRRQETRTLRDPYSSKPFVEFYTTMRVGGAVVLNEAYRLGKIATS